MKNETVKAVIRLIVTAMLMVNMCLTLVGKNPIPFDEAQITEFLTMCAAGLSTLWIWWKNNNVSKDAKEAQDYKNTLQGKNVMYPSTATTVAVQYTARKDLADINGDGSKAEEAAEETEDGE